MNISEFTPDYMKFGILIKWSSDTKKNEAIPKSLTSRKSLNQKKNEKKIIKKYCSIIRNCFIS